MQKTEKITIKHTTDDGVRLVLIPLRGLENRYVTMNEEDFDWLLSIGVHPIFKLKQHNVLITCKRKQVRVARLLTDCKEGENVRYLNGDVTDLRARNLLKLPGMARYGARSLIERTYPTIQYELEHAYKAA